jgi:hypothetical protein
MNLCQENVGKWMELKVMMLNEISQTQKDKHCMFPLIYASGLFLKDMKAEGGLLRRSGRRRNKRE